MAVTGNSREITIRGNLLKPQIHLKRDLLWCTLEIGWISVLLKLGNSEIILPVSVTIPLTNKCRVRNNMNYNEVISDIILFTG